MWRYTDICRREKTDFFYLRHEIALNRKRKTNLLNLKKKLHVFSNNEIYWRWIWMLEYTNCQNMSKDDNSTNTLLSFMRKLWKTSQKNCRIYMESVSISHAFMMHFKEVHFLTSIYHKFYCIVTPFLIDSISKNIFLWKPRFTLFAIFIQMCNSWFERKFEMSSCEIRQDYNRLLLYNWRSFFIYAIKLKKRGCSFENL